MPLPRRTAACLLLILLSTGVAKAAQGFTDQLTVGKQTLLDSKVLKEKRPLLISLPSGYDHSKARYPVIYLLDGESSFHFASGVVRFLSRSSMIPEMIVIGIPNIDRGKDFHRSLGDGSTEAPGPRRFQKFLKSELLPFVDATYRTLPYRVLWGHSATGTFVCRSLIADPDLFGAFIAASPSVGWEGDPFPSVGSEGSTRVRVSLHVAYGLVERPLFVETGEVVHNTLRACAPSWLHWKVTALEGDHHGSTPLKSLYQGLEYVFAGARAPSHDQLVEGGMDVVTEHHARTRRLYGSTIPIPDSVLGPAAMQLLNAGDLEQAVALLEENTRQNPGSWRAHNGLGEALLRQGKRERGCSSLAQAASLKPKDANYELVLNWLGYDLLRGPDKKTALAVFEMIVATYPESANAHDSLGDALAAIGEDEAAIKSYERALELAPANAEALTKLRKLKNE